MPRPPSRSWRFGEPRRSSVEPRTSGGGPPRVGVFLLLVIAAAGAGCGSGPTAAATDSPDTVRAVRKPFIRTLRVTGLVEAARSSLVGVPRLRGPGSGVLVVTTLVGGGTTVRQGDELVRFDPQAQQKVAFDRRAEYQDFAAQLARKEAEHHATRAKDESDLQNAERAVARAKLEMLKNEMLSAILAEKNEQTLAETEANLEMLRRVFDLKRRAERAERRALEIQRDRARNAMEHAEGNMSRMIISAPQDGLVVLKTIWKGAQMGEVQEGEEVRPGTPIVEVVDPSQMRVRARVNQADVPLLRAGQYVSIELDAYPAKRFTGVLQRVSPAGVMSPLNSRVRTFVTSFSIDQNDPALLPDLTAAVDIEVDRRDGALVVPREAIVRSSRGTVVHIVDDGETREQAVTVAAWNDVDAAIASGLTEGTLLLRRPAPEPKP